MKPYVKITAMLSLIVLAIACNKQSRKEEAASAIELTAPPALSLNRPAPYGTVGNALSEQSETANRFISSSAAVETGKDTSRKFIRTADMKFKVKSVIKATIAIEDIAAGFDGFVTYTNLQSTVDHVTTTPVSADSSVETTYYTVGNTMVVRVPNTLLDTALRSIARWIDYLDHRTIQAEDVKLQLLSNQLAQKRLGKTQQRITNAIDEKGKKLNETTTAEETALSKQEQADHALIANLSLQDKIAFSTINLYIYQRQTVKREIISNHKNIDAYRPDFISRFTDALKTGWEFLQTLIIATAKIWWVFVFAVAAYAAYRKLKR